MAVSGSGCAHCSLLDKVVNAAGCGSAIWMTSVTASKVDLNHFRHTLRPFHNRYPTWGSANCLHLISILSEKFSLRCVIDECCLCLCASVRSNDFFRIPFCIKQKTARGSFFCQKKNLPWKFLPASVFFLFEPRDLARFVFFPWCIHSPTRAYHYGLRLIGWLIMHGVNQIKKMPGQCLRVEMHKKKTSLVKGSDS